MGYMLMSKIFCLFFFVIERFGSRFRVVAIWFSV